MDHFKGITAQIISNGQVLDLYDDPDAAEIEESRSRHHYVEAVAGTTFELKVNLSTHFKFYKMHAENAVSVTVEVDGREEASVADSCTKKDLQRRFSQKRSKEFSFMGPTHFCEETGQWMWSDYSFGNLVLKEHSDPDFSAKKAQDLGKIQITIQRVKIVKRRVPDPLDTRSSATVKEVPEKALKGRSIDTFVEFANTRPARELSVLETKSISGATGKPVVFCIYYRSRRALQMMGCIPRSPSPEAQSPNSETTGPGDVIQEVRDLRARLALLERGLNVKSESSRAATGLKREREDDEASEGARQRRRTSVKAEFIDLTDD